MKPLHFTEDILKEYRGKRVSTKRNNKKCKRNRNLPHEFVLHERIKTRWGYKLRTWICKHCGKCDWFRKLENGGIGNTSGFEPEDSTFDS